MASSARRLRRLLHSSAIALLIVLSASAQSVRERDVRSILHDQQEAWNRGDIDGYMQGYWKNDSTTFVSGGTVTKGYNEVAGRYHRRYNNREAMGELSFEDLQVRFLAPTVAIAYGVWRLHRSADEPWGRFTLIIERKPEGWRITHDHTSSAP